MAEDAYGEQIENRSGWRERLRRWKSRVTPAPDRNSDQAAEMQQHDNSRVPSLESMSSTSVDIPIEYADDQQGEAIPNLPNVVISRTSSEPVIGYGRPRKVSAAGSAFSARSNWTTLGIERRKSFLGNLFQVWDNRLALKLFGSRKGILKEEERLKNCQHRVIHPCSKFRIYWDLMMVFILTLNVVLLPVSIAFFEDQINPGWLFFNSVSDLAFIIDIVLNFWTGIIMKDNTVILDLKVVRKVYAKKWLPLDIVSVFPFDYIALAISRAESLNSLVQATNALRLLRLFKLLSLLRLFRVVRFMHYLAKWEELFKATKAMARIVNFILAVLLLAHWNGCVQFLVPYIQGFPRDSWVSINNLKNATVGTQYSWAVFKAISHMLCIGFGRWPPQNTTEVWITIVSMLIGASLYAMFIGHISTLIHSANSSSRQYNEKLKQVEEYMRYRKLPIELKFRVHEYYYQRYHGQLFDEDMILCELSQALKEDVVNFNCQELVRVVPFFSNAEAAFITSVLTRLVFDVFLPGDFIIRYGAIGNKMYFIQHGIVDVVTGDGNVATCLCDGSYFGEICLLMKCRRVASVRAVTVCDLYCLSREDFEVVLDEFPHMRRIMETVATERLAMIKKTINPSSRRSHTQPISSLAGSACPLMPTQPKTKHYSPTLNTILSSRSASQDEYLEPEDVV